MYTEWPIQQISPCVNIMPSQHNAPTSIHSISTRAPSAHQQPCVTVLGLSRGALLGSEGLEARVQRLGRGAQALIRLPLGR